MLPEGMQAVVKKDSYEVPAIFKLLAKEGDIAEEMMYNTFNMGLGMVVAVDTEDVDKTMEAIKAAGDTPYVVGAYRSRRKRSYFMLKVAVLCFRRRNKPSGHYRWNRRMEASQMRRLMV